MIWKRWRALIADISSMNIGIYAANATFFLILSLFPALMLLLSILSLTSLSQDTLLSVVRSVIPDATEALMSYLINDLYNGTGVALLSVSAVTAAWSASRGMFSLMAGLNGIYGLKDRRNYVYRRLLCLFYTVVIFAALLLTLVLYVFGQRIALWLQAQAVPLFRMLLFVIRLRWLIVTIFLTVVFMVMYKVFPNRKLTFRSVLPGGILAAVGWMGFTELFSLYVNSFGGSYTMIYGSLATIAVSMLWLYSCMCILFFGAVLNRYLTDSPKTLLGLFRK